jgi:hypothetical protein
MKFKRGEDLSEPKSTKLLRSNEEATTALPITRETRTRYATLRAEVVTHKTHQSAAPFPRRQCSLASEKSVVLAAVGVQVATASLMGLQGFKHAVKRFALVGESGVANHLAERLPVRRFLNARENIGRGRSDRARHWAADHSTSRKAI